MDARKERLKALSGLTNEHGVYALCDLDSKPIYIGQSTDGIRTRVQRHLTSARSDIIANRRIDIWEVAHVWAWPLPNFTKDQITPFENYLLGYYHSKQPLMNGKIGPRIIKPGTLPKKQQIQILSDSVIGYRKDPMNRLPRQILHINNLFSYILDVKNEESLRRTLNAHFKRLNKYHKEFLKQSGD